MITLFACPKHFIGHIDVIQRNAIQSWSRLKPKPEIILLGNDKGVAEICKELGLIHAAEIDTNEYGTPLVNSVFQVGQARASFPIVCYINSDIMLMSDFGQAVKSVSTRMPTFLMIGQRWDIDIKEAWNFDSDNWEDDLRALLAQNGKLHAQTAMDYFVFPRGMYTDIPPFAIGRLSWDNWLVWRARTENVPIVDATPAAKIAHQNHDYSPGMLRKLDERESRVQSRGDNSAPIVTFDGNMVALGPEAQRNYALCPDVKSLNIWAATWMIDPQGVLKRWPLSIRFLYYQVRLILPLYWPAFGRLIHWMLKFKRFLLTDIRQGLKPRYR